jgi:hypothetical protein
MPFMAAVCAWVAQNHAWGDCAARQFMCRPEEMVSLPSIAVAWTCWRVTGPPWGARILAPALVHALVPFGRRRGVIWLILTMAIPGNIH